MAKHEDFCHPLIYLGDKEEKRVDMTGRLDPILFALGPLSGQPGPLYEKKYADVTEKEGRALVRRAPSLFAWPDGTKLGPQNVTREEFDALSDRLAAVEAAIAKPAKKDAKKETEAVTDG